MKPNLLNKMVLWLRSKGHLVFSKKFCYNNYRKCEKEDLRFMGNLFECLPEKDRDMIADYIWRYGPNGGVKGEVAPLSYRLRYWTDAKSKYLYRLFGGNLILEREIEYEASHEELVERYRQFTNYKCNHFYNELHSTIYTRPEFKSILYETWEPRVNGYGSFYSYITAINTLLTNRWEGPEMSIPLPDGKSFKVGPGTKIARILGRLAKEYNIPDWEEVRQAQANALTVKKTKGTLCISIHPMDYITMSDNAENWDSCMNWSDDGGYRAGTVEMMNSEAVVVAYLKHPTNTFEGWNSKTWRELYIVTPEIITNIKGYPYINSWLSTYVATWLKELAETSGVGLYEPEIKRYGETDRNDDPWFKKNNVNVFFYTNTMYNDCGRCDQYMYLEKGLHNRNININYSGTLNCMICGEPDTSVDFEETNSVVCLKCDSREEYYCDHCGDAMDREEVYFDDDGTPYCECCFNELFVCPVDDPDGNYLKEGCERFILRFPDGSYSDVRYKSYVKDTDSFLHNTELYNGPVTDWEDFEYDANDGVYIIPYENAGTDIKWACVLDGRDIIRWNNYGKPEEEIKELIFKEYPWSSLWF